MQWPWWSVKFPKSEIMDFILLAEGNCRQNCFAVWPLTQELFMNTFGGTALLQFQRNQRCLSLETTHYLNCTEINISYSFPTESLLNYTRFALGIQQRPECQRTSCCTCFLSIYVQSGSSFRSFVVPRLMSLKYLGNELQNSFVYLRMER